MTNALSFQVQQLLSLSGIPVDKQELDFQIQSHPSYPSLHAITGVLDHFAIDNVALDLPITAGIIEQLPTTYLAQVHLDEEKDFAIVHQIKDKYKLIFSKSKKETVTKAQLQERLTGIIVAVEATVDIETSVHKKLIPDNVLLVLLGVVLAGLVLVSSPNWSSLLFLVLSVTGLVVSIAIVKQQFGMQSQLGNAFCSGDTTIKDCNAVLTSDGATIVKGLKLSDASLVYFTSLTLLALALCLGSLTSAVFVGLSLLAIPVVLYSVYYQYAFAKAWCPLCLLISGVLLGQAGLSAFLVNAQVFPFPEISELLITATTFIGIFAAWSKLETMIGDFKDLRKLKIDYFKFKRNFDLFKTVLDKSAPINTSIPEVSELIFGNPQAALSIVVQTSPFCGHCKPVHKIIDQILKKYGDQVSVTIRCTVHIDQREGNLYKIMARLLEIYHANGQKRCLEALHDIYGDMEVSEWLDTWGLCEQPDLYETTFIAQKEWAAYHGINFTPEILLNGQSFPKEYDRKELPFFVEDLVEASQLQTSQSQLQSY